MKIAFTADVHIDSSRWNPEATKLIAERMAKFEPDVVVIAGDAGNTLRALEKALVLFDSIDARRLFVPGNHDVWTETYAGKMLDSRTKYELFIPEACQRIGFDDLGQAPVVIDGVGFVGSLGWYDYTFADSRLSLTEEDYWKGRYGDEIWWDQKMTFWTPSKAEFPDAPLNRMWDPAVCGEMADLLDAHIREIESDVDRIVAVVHTLPFVAGLPRSNPPYYLDAYTGSERLGQILEAHPKVTHCIGGHKHLGGDWTAGNINIHRRVLGRIESEDDIDLKVVQAVGMIEV